MPGAEERAGRDATPGTAEAFDRLLHLLGRFNYAWTNTESVLIHVIAGLARLDLETATVIFLTLNTTRARLSLVERMAKMPRHDAKLREEILALTKRMGRALTMRNRYNHCIYAFDSEGVARTINMRVFDTAKEVRFGRSYDVDEDALARVGEALDETKAINADLWALIGRWDFPRQEGTVDERS